MSCSLKQLWFTICSIGPFLAHSKQVQERKEFSQITVLVFNRSPLAGNQITS